MTKGKACGVGTGVAVGVDVGVGVGVAVGVGVGVGVCLMTVKLITSGCPGFLPSCVAETAPDRLYVPKGGVQAL